MKPDFFLPRSGFVQQHHGADAVTVYYFYFTLVARPAHCEPLGVSLPLSYPYARIRIRYVSAPRKRL